MTFKVILSGHLEFGNERSFEKVVNMYAHRVENYYKNDVLIDAETAFDASRFVFNIKRFAGSSTDRCWRNTINLLELVAQYSIAGSIHAWKLNEGQLLAQKYIEPKGDKTAVQSFLQGRELIVEGKEDEAKEALSRAIEKFARHALAYERRGYVNYLLGNVEDALYDFNKSIDICAQSPDAFMGRAIIYIRQKRYKEAIEDLDMATKTSIPHQPIYWRARRMKGECHLELEEYQKAEFEFRLFTRKKFASDNPNHNHQKKATFDYGQVLLGLKKYDEAIAAFDKALELPSANENVTKADQFLMRGIALQKAGRDGYLEEFNKAANCGSDRAVELLAEMV